MNLSSCAPSQIAKLSMIPVSCLLEVFFDKVRYSRSTKLSIILVMAGVGICTVADITVNVKGFAAAAVAVWSTALQQYVSSDPSSLPRPGLWEPYTGCKGRGCAPP